MNSSRTNKLASIFSTLTAAAAVSLGLTGCVVTGSAGFDGDIYVDPTPVATVAEVAIDSGATMTADPGYGVGVFVQYDAGGFWTVYTTCDTEISGSSCNFDILVSADSRVYIDNVQGFDLESGDSIDVGIDGSINLVTDTAYGMNGFTFDADPGAIIELDVLLDGIAQPSFVYAVSDGALLKGVPTNPVDFVPSDP
ncbi:Hypothetical protein A7982_04485 [Minicystis rosea]|nr:Hypothetical protein A7982_04485 [Minicystis rosea]